MFIFRMHTCWIRRHSGCWEGAGEGGGAEKSLSLVLKPCLGQQGIEGRKDMGTEKLRGGVVCVLWWSGICHTHTLYSSMFIMYSWTEGLVCVQGLCRQAISSCKPLGKEEAGLRLMGKA